MEYTRSTHALFEGIIKRADFFKFDKEMQLEIDYWEGPRQVLRTIGKLDN